MDNHRQLRTTTEEPTTTRPSSSVPTPASYSCSTPSAASPVSSTTSSPSTAKRKSTSDSYSSVAGKRHHSDLQSDKPSTSIAKRRCSASASASRSNEVTRKNSSTSDASTSEEPNAVVCRASCRYFPRKVLLLSLTGGKDGNQASGTTHLMGEMATRVKSCDFILKAGKVMGFPVSTIATAQLLYHRFFLFHTSTEAKAINVAIASLFVAGKVEETIKKLRDVLSAAHAVLRPEEPEMDYESQEAFYLRNTIVAYEKLILETMCFDFHVEHPFRYVIKFVKLLKGDIALAKRAWDIAMDSHKTTLVLQYPAHTIAAGSVYLASMLSKAKLRRLAGKSVGKDTLFTRPEDVPDFCHQMLDFYIIKATDDKDLHLYSNTKRNLQRMEQKGEFTSSTSSTGMQIPSATVSPASPGLPYTPSSIATPTMPLTPALAEEAITDGTMDEGDISMCPSPPTQPLYLKKPISEYCNFRYLFRSSSPSGTGGADFSNDM